MYSMYVLYLISIHARDFFSCNAPIWSIFTYRHSRGQMLLMEHLTAMPRKKSREYWRWEKSRKLELAMVGWIWRGCLRERERERVPDDSPCTYTIVLGENSLLVHSKVFPQEYEVAKSPRKDLKVIVPWKKWGNVCERTYYIMHPE